LKVGFGCALAQPVAYLGDNGVTRNMNNDLIEVNPDKMSGAPCFKGTRVPVTHLFDYLEAGDSLGDFLNDFPTVTREQALGVLEMMRERLLTEYETAA
jgi:uncharacterized protein (DUF433 family)